MVKYFWEALYYSTNLFEILSGHYHLKPLRSSAVREPGWLVIWITTKMMTQGLRRLSLGQGPSAGKWQNWPANQGGLAPKSMMSMTAQGRHVEKELIIIFLEEGFFLTVQRPKGELVLVSLQTTRCMVASTTPASPLNPSAQAKYLEHFLSS